MRVYSTEQQKELSPKELIFREQQRRAQEEFERLKGLEQKAYDFETGLNRTCRLTNYPGELDKFKVRQMAEAYAQENLSDLQRESILYQAAYGREEKPYQSDRIMAMGWALMAERGSYFDFDF
jgi:hypothetical protein